VNSVIDTEILVTCNRTAPADDGTATDELALHNARIALLLSFANGERRAVYNQKLIVEYSDKIKARLNDAVIVFIKMLMEKGIKSPRSSLLGGEEENADRAEWPPHDRHLLAASVGVPSSEICVIEPRLARCAEEVWRLFRRRVRKV